MHSVKVYNNPVVEDLSSARKAPKFSDARLWFGLMLNVPVNDFSDMLERSHRSLGITSIFSLFIYLFIFFAGGGGGVGYNVLLKDTTRRLRMPENFAVTYLKFKQRGKTLGYFVKMMQME